jgi:hypothetical protein
MICSLRPPRVLTPVAGSEWIDWGAHLPGSASKSFSRSGNGRDPEFAGRTHSFYALAKDVKDEDLKKRILAKVYRLTATN